VYSSNQEIIVIAAVQRELGCYLH